MSWSTFWVGFLIISLVVYAGVALTVSVEFSASEVRLVRFAS